jgi:hypothetical protein
MADPKKRPIQRPPAATKKKPGKTPITKTIRGREVGIGGLRRLRDIDDIVDRAQSGKKK